MRETCVPVWRLCVAGHRFQLGRPAHSSPRMEEPHAQVQPPRYRCRDRHPGKHGVYADADQRGYCSRVRGAYVHHPSPSRLRERARHLRLRASDFRINGGYHNGGGRRGYVRLGALIERRDRLAKEKAAPQLSAGRPALPARAEDEGRARVPRREARAVPAGARRFESAR